MALWVHVVCKQQAQLASGRMSRCTPLRSARLPGRSLGTS